MNFKKTLVAYLFTVACIGKNIVMADVINGSGNSIYVKPENDSKLIEVRPGDIYKGSQDGVVSEGRVVKNSDGTDLIIEKGGKVNIMQKNPITNIVESVRAGQLETSPDAGWDPAFAQATKQKELKDATETKARVTRQQETKDKMKRPTTRIERPKIGIPTIDNHSMGEIYITPDI